MFHGVNFVLPSVHITYLRVLRSKLKEFLDLEQGNHIVFDHMRQFNTLAQYDTYHVDTDEKRPTCIVQGSPSICRST
jgi:hypothetical protein